MSSPTAKHIISLAYYTMFYFLKSISSVMLNCELLLRETVAKDDKNKK